MKKKPAGRRVLKGELLKKRETLRAESAKLERLLLRARARAEYTERSQRRIEERFHKKNERIASINGLLHTMERVGAMGYYRKKDSSISAFFDEIGKVFSISYGTIDAPFDTPKRVPYAP